MKMKKSYSEVNIVLAFINLLLKILLLLTTKQVFTVLNEWSRGRASMSMRNMSVYVHKKAKSVTPKFPGGAIFTPCWERKCEH